VISTILLSHFVILSTRFCYTELNHFCYSAKLFFDCYNTHPFLIDTVLSNFFIATVLSHILIAILLSHSSLIQCSIIPRCYSAQSFFTATVFSNSLCYSTCVTTRVGGDSVGGVACAGGGSQLGCGRTGPSRVNWAHEAVRDRVTQGEVCMARSVGWIVGSR
jgi:hypothetical protein